MEVQCASLREVLQAGQSGLVSRLGKGAMAVASYEGFHRGGSTGSQPVGHELWGLNDLSQESLITCHAYQPFTV